MKNTESGMSLMELMIGVGILSLIAFAASHFFSKVTQSDVEMSAKVQAQAELNNLTNLLEKDLKFRELDKLVDLCGTPLCKELKIDRLAPGGGSYSVTYRSSCEDIPANSKFSKLDFQALGDNSKCISALKCGLGKYPRLSITVDGAPAGVKLPPYPANTPVYGSKRTAFGMVGAAICASQTVTENIATPTPTTISRNRIILEGAIIGSADVIRIERKETVFSSNNMAKIQMLPN